MSSVATHIPDVHLRVWDIVKATAHECLIRIAATMLRYLAPISAGAPAVILRGRPLQFLLFHRLEPFFFCFLQAAVFSHQGALQ